MLAMPQIAVVGEIGVAVRQRPDNRQMVRCHAAQRRAATQAIDRDRRRKTIRAPARRSSRGCARDPPRRTACDEVARPRSSRKSRRGNGSRALPASHSRRPPAPCAIACWPSVGGTSVICPRRALSGSQGALPVTAASSALANTTISARKVTAPCGIRDRSHLRPCADAGDVGPLNSCARADQRATRAARGNGARLAGKTVQGARSRIPARAVASAASTGSR